MTKRIKALLAGLTLAASAFTGLAVTNAAIAPPDTTWGAPATADDTTWGTTPVDTPESPTGPVVTPLDTTWG